jgi:hypothetical protein
MSSIMFYDSDIELSSVVSTPTTTTASETESEGLPIDHVEILPDDRQIIRIDELISEYDSEENSKEESNVDTVSNQCMHCGRITCCMVEFEKEFSIECSNLREEYNRQVAGNVLLSPKVRHNRKHHYHLRCRQWICLRMNELVPEGFPFRNRIGLRSVRSQLNWLLEYPSCISHRIIQEFSYPEYTESEEEYESDDDMNDENVGAPLPHFSVSGRRAYAEYIRSKMLANTTLPKSEVN